MIPKFSLHEPDSIKEASSLLSELKGQARILAGGTELFLLAKLGLSSWQHLVSIRNVSELNRLELQRDRLRIGAAVTHRILERSSLVQEQFPLLAELEGQIANVRIRNVGTLGGNLAFAEPRADPATLLLAYGARVKVQNSKGERVLPLKDFFVDYYTTALALDEILTEIEVPRPHPHTTGAYLRVRLTERPAVSVACLLSCDGGGVKQVVLTLGGVSPKPLRLESVEAALQGKGLEEAARSIEGESTIAAEQCTPFEDLTMSAECKRHMVKVLVTRAFLEACNKAKAARL